MNLKKLSFVSVIFLTLVSSCGSNNSSTSSADLSSSISSSESNSSSISSAESQSSTNTPTSSSSTSSVTSSELNSYNKSEITCLRQGGLFESAYVEFNRLTDAEGYICYVKKEGSNTWTKIDNQLVRVYKEYDRVDAMGLASWNYNIKIVPVLSGSENEEKSVTSDSLKVTSYHRDGYAFKNNTNLGAYNQDGTLKDKAVVLYVSDDNSSSITFNVITGKSNKTTTGTGIQEILTLLKKGYDTRPIDIRFIGNVKTPSDFTSTKNESICKGDLVIDGNGKITSGITVEGVGNDTVFNGFGVRLKNADYVELRNIGFMNCASDEGDDCGLQQSNTHIWVHNCDFFYGEAGSDSDQVKGDGALDCKKSNYVTFSYNHFFDNGKCNLLGLSEKNYDFYITYDHNWYDHSDSRHPRVRYYNAHVYNNYYDGNAKYGIGACLGSSVFSEGNYFRNCKYPMLSSMQGTDYAGYVANKSGTFSEEDGGIIKSYDNHFDSGTYIPYSSSASVDFDFYGVTSRDEKVPSTVVTKKGNTSYSNFDTDSTLKDNSTPDKSEDIPSKVTSSAGRLQQGDFKWAFNNSVDDTSYTVNTALKAALENYVSGLVSIGGYN